MVVCLEQGADLHNGPAGDATATHCLFLQFYLSGTGSSGKSRKRGPLNGCVCVCVCVISMYFTYVLSMLNECERF